jgi:hypothetical protein
MHFAIVVACSGSVYTPPLELTAAGGSSATAPPDDSASMGGASSAFSGGVGGAQSEPSMMPVAEAQAAESGTRLKARWYVGEDGSRQPTFQWFDSARNEDCTFQMAADGVLRCIPGGYPQVSYFSDDACTARIFAFGIAAPSSCSVNAVPKYAVVSSVEGCTSRARVFQVGSVTDPSQLYLQSGESCVAALSDGVEYHVSGPEVAAASFVAVQLVTDP